MSDELKNVLELLNELSNDENLENLIISLDIWKEFLIEINKLKNSKEYQIYFNDERL